MDKPSPVRLWNPAAAAGWSLIFSPLFGAWIHAKNWQELGRPEEARKSMWWVYGWAAFYCLLLAMSGLLTLRETSAPWMTLYAVWYMTSADAQVKLVKEGLVYERKSWAGPMVGAVVVATVLVAMSVWIAIVRLPTLVQQLESTSVPVVTRLMKERLHGSSTCQQVKVVEALPGGAYRAEAFMDDGKKLRVLLSVKEQHVFVEIPAQ